MSDGLSAWVTAETKKRDWSLRELARQASISHTLVSRTLAGKMPPSADFCIKIAAALDTSPIYLLQLAGILPDEPAFNDSELGPITREILELVQELPPDQRRQVLDFTRFLRRGS